MLTRSRQPHQSAARTALPQIAPFGSSEHQNHSAGATEGAAPPCLQATIRLHTPALCFVITGLLCVWQTNLQSAIHKCLVTKNTSGLPYVHMPLISISS